MVFKILKLSHVRLYLFLLWQRVGVGNSFECQKKIELSENLSLNLYLEGNCKHLGRRTHCKQVASALWKEDAQPNGCLDNTMKGWVDEHCTPLCKPSCKLFFFRGFCVLFISFYPCKWDPGIWSFPEALLLAKHWNEQSLPMGSASMDSTSYKLGISGRWRIAF